MIHVTLSALLAGLSLEVIGNLRPVAVDAILLDKLTQ